MSGYRVATIAAAKALANTHPLRIDGTWCVIDSEGCWYSYNAAASDTVSEPRIFAPSDNNGRFVQRTISPNNPEELGALTVIAPAILPDAATIAIDATLRNSYRINLTSAIGATRQIANPTNPANNQTIEIVLVQPSAGGCQATLGGKFRLAEGSPTQLNTGPNKIAVLTAKYVLSADAWLTTLANF